MEFLAYCQDLVDRMRRLRWDQTGNHRRPFGALNLRSSSVWKKPRENLKHFRIRLENECSTIFCLNSSAIRGHQELLDGKAVQARFRTVTMN